MPGNRNFPGRLRQGHFRVLIDPGFREARMIKVSVLYPHEDGAGFDMDYYLGSHIPMVREKLGAACKAIAVEQGLGGGAPGSSPAFVAMGHLSFESVAAFQNGVRAACGGDHGRYPELHRHPADHPDQRREAFVSGLRGGSLPRNAEYQPARHPFCPDAAAITRPRWPRPGT